MPSTTSAPAATIEPEPITRAVQQDRAHADQAPVLDRAAVDHRGMPDRHVVADGRRVRVLHDVHDRAVLDVRSAADADLVHVAADDDRHPDAALFADLHVADDLGAVVDEGGRVDARHAPAVGPKHSGRIIPGRQGRQGGGQEVEARSLALHLPALPALPALCLV